MMGGVSGVRVLCENLHRTSPNQHERSRAKPVRTTVVKRNRLCSLVGRIPLITQRSVVQIHPPQPTSPAPCKLSPFPRRFIIPLSGIGGSNPPPATNSLFFRLITRERSLNVLTQAKVSDR